MLFKHLFLFLRCSYCRHRNWLSSDIKVEAEIAYLIYDYGNSLYVSMVQVQINKFSICNFIDKVQCYWWCAKLLMNCNIHRVSDSWERGNFLIVIFKRSWESPCKSTAEYIYIFPNLILYLCSDHHFDWQDMGTNICLIGKCETGFQ